MKWIEKPCPQRDSCFKDNAIQRQAQLTKPAGSLGRLEDIAIRLADCQQSDQPTINNIAISVFAADHGIAEEGVSAFPQEVTPQMVVNFLQGGAAISVMAKHLKADLEVVDVGMLTTLTETLPKTLSKSLISHRAGNGTKNMLNQPAMTEDQLSTAFAAGYEAIERAIKNKADLFIGGEMGIANTTSAAVLYCALLGLTPEQAAGAGTGLDEKGIQHKIKIVKAILDKHGDCDESIEQGCKNKTLQWLRCTGGFEIVALTGAYVRAAQCGLPVLVDGFISTVAALCAVCIQPEMNDYLFFSHISAEQGHQKVLENLQQEPLLDLGMRLGEGSGSAVAVSLLQSACVLHNQMATFEEAAVATSK